MNYIDQINAFERWCDSNYLHPTSQLLWYKLFKLNNRAGWVEWVQIDNLRLMAEIGIRREASFIDYRDNLITAGLIEYKKGRKGHPNKYHITTLYTFNNEVQSVVQSEVQPVVQSVVKTADIYKLNQTKLNNKIKKDTKVSKKSVSEKSKTKANPNPPTLEEVRQYCEQRKNNIDPDKFFEYYNLSKWIDSKGNKVKNWKQRIISWEGNSRIKEPQKQADKIDPIKQNEIINPKYEKIDSWE